MEQVALATPDPRSQDTRSPVTRPSSGRGRPIASGALPVTPFRALPVEPVPPVTTPIPHPERPTPTRRPHNLPHPLTSFVGRTREIAEVKRLLAGSRLLTLTGSGGVGKTRLAHEVAVGLLDAHPDGVWLVELAALREAALVPRAVATVLGLRDQSACSLMPMLCDTLQDQRVLLILDNCEHLVEACAALVNTLLRACPDIRILTTSRQPLGTAGETTFRVPSLSLAARRDDPSAPPAEHAGTAASIANPDAPVQGTDRPAATSDAVCLFVERAQAAVPDFTLTDSNLAVVEQVCRRLDGIPLAIELAAARIAVLSPEQIAGRLGDRFGLLTGGCRTALPRHQTLRALVDWSYDLLDEREQTLFRRLAVFGGGWTLEAAESVCGLDGLAPHDVLDVLSGLVAKSLVATRRDTDAVRYWFLESLREYATDRLRDAGEEARFRERQCAWVLTLAEQATPELCGPRQEAWLNRLDGERENLRAAQRWAVSREDAETTARLGAALWQFWWARADAADAREWISTIVPLARNAQPTRALAQALHGAGMLAGAQADYPTCRSLLREALAAARQVDDAYTLANVLDSLARQLSFEGHYAESNQHLNESLAILRQLGDRQALARALSRFGFLKYLEGDHQTARATLEEGLAVAHEAGDPAMVAEILDKLGQMFHSDGDLEGAVRSFQQAEPIWRELGQGIMLAMTLNNLGNTQTLRGELATARIQLAEALGLSQRVGNRRRMAFTLSSVATLAVLDGDPARGLRLDAVSSAAVAEMGIQRVPPRVPLRAHVLERARQALGGSASAVALATGQAMTVAQAVEETLAWLAEPRPSAPADTQSAHDAPPAPRLMRPVLAATPTRASATTLIGPGALSPRQLEVAALVARGLSNRQIANELVITEGTAANHVKGILANLGFDSRVQVALWAIEHGLAERAPARIAL